MPGEAIFTAIIHITVAHAPEKFNTDHYCPPAFFDGIHAQSEIKLKKKDRKRDIEFVTTDGIIILRLSDSTPLHRDNFLRLVKSHFYDSLLFHRVIQYFMIQGGDPKAGTRSPGQALGDSSPPYTIPRNSG